MDVSFFFYTIVKKKSTGTHVLGSALGGKDTK